MRVWTSQERRTTGRHTAAAAPATLPAELAGALLPPPLVVVGVYGAEGSPFLQQHTEPGGVAAAHNSSSSSSSGVQYSVQQGGTLAACQPEVLPTATDAGSGMLPALAQRYLPVRCTADLVLHVGSSGLQAAFDDLEEQLCGPTAVYIAEVPAAAGSPAGAAAAGGAAAAQRPVLLGAQSFSALGASWASAAALRPLQQGCPGGAATPCAAPRLSWQPRPDGLRHCALSLDVLCYVPADMPAAEAVGSLVRPAVRRQLAAMRAAAAAAAPSLPPQSALHFQPPGFCHHVTLVSMELPAATLMILMNIAALPINSRATGSRRQQPSSAT
jgi:hypothetical protein